VTGAADFRDLVYARYRAAGPARAAAPEGLLGAGGEAFLAEVVRRHFPPSRDARILDLGCGAGFLLRAARRAGYAQSAGIDASPEQVALAARLGIAGVAQGDLRAHAAGLAPSSLDAVLAFDVLEHLTKEESFALAGAVHRALAPGGRFVLHTVNAESPFFGRVRYGDVTHLEAFTRESLDQLLGLAGFAAVRCHEDRPAVHGIASALRRLAWPVLRAPLVAFLVAESGPAAGRAILSQNLLCVATK
jgi:SAM-dependent methyltransferase